MAIHASWMLLLHCGEGRLAVNNTHEVYWSQAASIFERLDDGLTCRGINGLLVALINESILAARRSWSPKGMAEWHSYQLSIRLPNPNRLQSCSFIVILYIVIIRLLHHQCCNCNNDTTWQWHPWPKFGSLMYECMNVRTGLVISPVLPPHQTVQKTFTRSEVVPTPLNKEGSRPEDSYNDIWYMILKLILWRDYAYGSWHQIPIAQKSQKLGWAAG